MVLTIVSLARQSLSALVFSDSPLDSMSYQGDIGIAATGSGKPWSRAASSTVVDRAPPAESPVVQICCGL